MERVDSAAEYIFRCAPFFVIRKKGEIRIVHVAVGSGRRIIASHLS